MKFLARFQRLERARAGSTEARGSEAERFTALEEAAPLPEVRTPPSGRFAPSELPLELDRDGEAQPFVRCQACGRDSQRGTVRCACGARLDTPEAAAFNASLWTELQDQRSAESAERHRALGVDLADAQRDAERRALGEQLAREVAERERWSEPQLPSWAALVGLGFGVLVLARFHRPAVLALAVGVLVVAGRWWWRSRGRRPPGR